MQQLRFPQVVDEWLVTLHAVWLSLYWYSLRYSYEEPAHSVIFVARLIDSEFITILVD